MKVIAAITLSIMIVLTVIEVVAVWKNVEQSKHVLSARRIK